MLNHAHRQPEELKTVNGTAFATHREAYELCLEIYNHPDDYFGNVVVLEPEEVFEEASDEELQACD